ncbi:uncharacterized protein FOMMEDRAFT_20316 [Fomitiporia mediterranea MF3/22]|uniref:uncharacterized protein n=1 Tax=Fomitiporia mediterranea (strain MF3/22) TaxID=694068 RepID=UPI0004408B4E|nr:uncharacterized protein FOMMEDRAFT_20316 [Fomitiporia mediterranea MF3/22]EJD03158.1 hypothetical protein FOMMEDRAFT_20316 [Fomitiporia mediterranea MF3/22]
MTEPSASRNDFLSYSNESGYISCRADTTKIRKASFSLARAVLINVLQLACLSDRATLHPAKIFH